MNSSHPVTIRPGFDYDKIFEFDQACAELKEGRCTCIYRNGLSGFIFASPDGQGFLLRDIHGPDKPWTPTEADRNFGWQTMPF